VLASIEDPAVIARILSHLQGAAAIPLRLTHWKYATLSR
jgi:hypothetical protein